MAVAVDMTYSRSGIDTYHKAAQHLGFTDDEHPGEGILFHWVEATGAGFVIHDVWESEEQFNAFFEDQLAPMASALGTEEPDVVVTEVYGFRRPT